MGLSMEMEQDISAFSGLIASIEKPAFQKDLLNQGESLANAKRYVNSQVEGLSPSARAKVGRLIIYGLSLGKSEWDESTQTIASLIFPKLTLQGMSREDLLSLRNDYFRAVARQGALPLEQRSTDALLTVGTSLLPQLVMEGEDGDLVVEMRKAWKSVPSSAGEEKRVEGIIDLLGEQPRVGRRRDPAVALRREYILLLSKHGMELPKIEEATEIPRWLISNDLDYLQREGLYDSGLRREPRRGPRVDPAVTQRREKVLALSKQGMKPFQINEATGIPKHTIYDDLYYLRIKGLYKRRSRRYTASDVLLTSADIVDFQTSLKK